MHDAHDIARSTIDHASYSKLTDLGLARKMARSMFDSMSDNSKSEMSEYIAQQIVAHAGHQKIEIENDLRKKGISI